MERRIKAIAALIAAGLALVLAATALAAHPKAGKSYAGIITNYPKIEGFSPPVSFSVSSGGTKLLSFNYGTFGCGGGVGELQAGSGPVRQWVDDQRRSDHDLQERSLLDRGARRSRITTPASTPRS